MLVYVSISIMERRDTDYYCNTVDQQAALQWVQNHVGLSSISVFGIQK